MHASILSFIVVCEVVIIFRIAYIQQQVNQHTHPGGEEFYNDQAILAPLLWSNVTWGSQHASMGCDALDTPPGTLKTNTWDAPFLLLPTMTDCGISGQLGKPCDIGYHRYHNYWSSQQVGVIVRDKLEAPHPVSPNMATRPHPAYNWPVGTDADFFKTRKFDGVLVHPTLTKCLSYTFCRDYWSTPDSVSVSVSGWGDFLKCGKNDQWMGFYCTQENTLKNGKIFNHCHTWNETDFSEILQKKFLVECEIPTTMKISVPSNFYATDPNFEQGGVGAYLTTHPEKKIVAMEPTYHFYQTSLTQPCYVTVATSACEFDVVNVYTGEILSTPKVPNNVDTDACTSQPNGLPDNGWTVSKTWLTDDGASYQTESPKQLTFPATSTHQDQSYTIVKTLKVFHATDLLLAVVEDTFNTAFVALIDSDGIDTLFDNFTIPGNARNVRSLPATNKATLNEDEARVGFDGGLVISLKASTREITKKEGLFQMANLLIGECL